MIAAQAASESTPIHKIAARCESRSACLLSGVAAANDVEISSYGSLGILSVTSCKLNRNAAGPDARTGRQWTRARRRTTGSVALVARDAPLTLC
jgi:hypothetical protein